MCAPFSFKFLKSSIDCNSCMVNPPVSVSAFYYTVTAELFHFSSPGFPGIMKVDQFAGNGFFT
ncbi:hypothetical protein B4098_2462 [Heyndrickxia coagulans]|uniref:Uncharacterized protein n=1 Tax=Heyndrickxia coagulans TaxID=1398 RepID=A0A150JNA9_HEYCO|nr:hypothetical protein B4098_2462 [Heyndrickxia coagulans]